MNAKQEAEKLEWLQERLIQLANQEPEDIESNDLNIYGEDDSGREGCTTVQITETAQEAFDTIKNLLKELEAKEFTIAAYIQSEAGLINRVIEAERKLAEAERKLLLQHDYDHILKRWNVCSKRLEATERKLAEAEKWSSNWGLRRHAKGEIVVTHKDGSGILIKDDVAGIAETLFYRMMDEVLTGSDYEASKGE